MVKGRYEQTNEDDEYDEYAQYQKNPPKRNKPMSTSRYEIHRTSLKDRQDHLRAIPLEVYYNGSPDKSYKIAFSQKKYKLFASLLDECWRCTKRTCVRLYKWPSKEEVIDAAQIESEEASNIYVCTDGKKKLVSCGYGGVGANDGGGSGEKQSRNSRNSRSTNRSQKPSPTTMRGANGAGSRPIHITVISNMDRSKKQSLFVDPMSKQPFEVLMQNVTEMLEMEDTCLALVSCKPPHKKVESISSLNRVLPSAGDTFWACGREGDPTEKVNYKPHDNSPTRNGQQKQKGAPQQNGHGETARQSNGNMRQSDTYEDSRGREYQRHNGNQRHQPDGYDSADQSPDRRQGYESPIEQYSPPPRDDRRGGAPREPPNKNDRYDEDSSSPNRRNGNDNRKSKDQGARQKPAQQAAQQPAQQPVRKSEDREVARKNEKNGDRDVARKNEKNDRNDPKDDRKKNDRDDDDDEPRHNRRDNRKDDDERKQKRQDSQDDDKDRRNTSSKDDAKKSNRRDSRNDDDDDRRQKRQDSDDDDDDDRRRVEPSPSPTEMRRRIEEMDQPKKSSDDEVDY